MGKCSRLVVGWLAGHDHWRLHHRRSDEMMRLNCHGSTLGLMQCADQASRRDIPIMSSYRNELTLIPIIGATLRGWNRSANETMLE